MRIGFSSYVPQPSAKIAPKFGWEYVGYEESDTIKSNLMLGETLPDKIVNVGGALQTLVNFTDDEWAQYQEQLKTNPDLTRKEFAKSLGVPVIQSLGGIL